MLVLSRKKNESIVINGNIRIEILQIKGKQIRLGITAPSSMKVLRSELPAASAPDNSGKRNTAKSENCDSSPAPLAPRIPPVAEATAVIDLQPCQYRQRNSGFGLVGLVPPTN